MSDAVAEICQWARTIPRWEQETLRRILAGEEFDEEGYQALAVLLLAGRDAPAVDLTSYEDANWRKDHHKTKLLAISKTTNVNALIEEQTIEFGEGLTALFGANASGKSGYARLFGNACFTRGDREVLPNFLKTGSTGQEQRATISLEKDGKRLELIHRCDRTMPELAGFYVFDSTSVSAHLTKANALTFTPPGLEILKELATHTDAVRRIVNSAIMEASQPRSFGAFFEGDSTVATYIRGLGGATDLDELNGLAQISASEREPMEELEKEIARLKLLDVSKAIVEKRREIETLRQLRIALAALDAAISDGVVAEAEQELAVLQRQKKRAEDFGAQQFKISGLNTPGSGIWAEFVQIARHLADREGTADKQYPHEESRCLLCQQPLSSEAAALLHRIWAFLEDDPTQSLEKARRSVAVRRSAIIQQGCQICEPTSVAYQDLTSSAPTLLESLVTYQASAERRRQAILNAIDHPPDVSPFVQTVPSLATLPITQLDTVIRARQDQMGTLEKTNPAERILAANKKVLQFTHRELLAKHLSAITKYVIDLRSASDARTKVNTSHHITTKHNEMFDARVSDRYRALFEKLLTDLGRALRVKIAAKGQKGVAFKTLELDLPGASQHPRGLPQHVFSEGEKRAVVLADFLTEVALDPNSAGIILDDPVTSLDAEWKDNIARVLVEQSKMRQVIIFTHDLHFLYLLHRHAEALEAQILSHWIRRGSDNVPGYVFLNNSPASEKQYRTTQVSAEHLAQAKEASNPHEEERYLREGFAALRTTYEVFVLRDLFGDVVQRFDERISIDRLKDAHLSHDIVKAVVDKVGKLSRFIEGHSHSDVTAAVRPDIATLQKEITDFNELKAKQKSAKKDAAAKGN